MLVRRARRRHRHNNTRARRFCTADTVQAAEGYANPQTPIPVILQRDEELGLHHSHGDYDDEDDLYGNDDEQKEVHIPPPPPAYGLWRSSVVRLHPIPFPFPALRATKNIKLTPHKKRKNSAQIQTSSTGKHGPQKWSKKTPKPPPPPTPPTRLPPSSAGEDYQDHLDIPWKKNQAPPPKPWMFQCCFLVMSVYEGKWKCIWVYAGKGVG